jgi:hypothetical protein
MKNAKKANFAKEEACIEDKPPEPKLITSPEFNHIDMLKIT